MEFGVHGDSNIHVILVLHGQTYLHSTESALEKGLASHIIILL